jgi:hypothetical protein
VTVYLYEVCLPARVYCTVSDGSTFIHVGHLDGMYSVGVTERGTLVHLGATAPLTANLDGTFTLESDPNASVQP